VNEFENKTQRLIENNIFWHRIMNKLAKCKPREEFSYIDFLNELNRERYKILIS